MLLGAKIRIVDDDEADGGSGPLNMFRSIGTQNHEGRKVSESQSRKKGEYKKQVGKTLNFGKRRRSGADSEKTRK